MIVEKQKVIVTDIQMPFWSMVMFMIKWTIASIPAFIILTVLVLLFGAVISGLLMGTGALPGIESGL